MNEIVNKFLLVGDRFMPEIHLKQPGFTYNACGPLAQKQSKSASDPKYDDYQRRLASAVLQVF